jgi:hypothetical protein
LHWSFPDPSAFQGPPEARLIFTRNVRDAIKARIKVWCAERCATASD